MVSIYLSQCRPWHYHLAGRQNVYQGVLCTPNYTRRLRDEWAYLRQTTTVSDYYARLTQLAIQLGEVDEERLVDKFIRGLKPKTRTEVELRDPQTLEQASRIAYRFDTIVYQRLPSSPCSLPTKKTPAANLCNWIPCTWPPSKPRLNLGSSESLPTTTEHTCAAPTPVSSVANKDTLHANAPPRVTQTRTASRPGCLCWSTPPGKNTHDNPDSII
jgi:Retrotransposon gag protein